MYYLGEHELNVLGSMMYRQEDYTEAIEQIKKDQKRSNTVGTTDEQNISI